MLLSAREGSNFVDLWSIGTGKSANSVDALITDCRDEYYADERRQGCVVMDKSLKREGERSEMLNG